MDGRKGGNRAGGIAFCIYRNASKDILDRNRNSKPLAIDSHSIRILHRRGSYRHCWPSITQIPTAVTTFLAEYAGHRLSALMLLLLVSTLLAGRPILTVSRTHSLSLYLFWSGPVSSTTPIGSTQSIGPHYSNANSEREDNNDACNRKTDSRLLLRLLRIHCLVSSSVGHRYGRVINNVGAKADQQSTDPCDHVPLTLPTETPQT